MGVSSSLSQNPLVWGLGFVANMIEVGQFVVEFVKSHNLPDPPNRTLTLFSSQPTQFALLLLIANFALASLATMMWLMLIFCLKQSASTTDVTSIYTASCIIWLVFGGWWFYTSMPTIETVLGTLTTGLLLMLVAVFCVISLRWCLIMQKWAYDLTKAFRSEE